MASFIGPLRSNDRFVWIRTTFSIFIHWNAIVLDWKALAKVALTPGNHPKGCGLFIDVALVLVRPFQPETIPFRWMKVETTQLIFVQSMLIRSSDLKGHIKLAKFRLFITVRRADSFKMHLWMPPKWSFRSRPCCCVNNFLHVSIFMQHKRDFIVSAALRHKSHSPDASKNSSEKLWQFSSEQIVQSWKASY